MYMKNVGLLIHFLMKKVYFLEYLFTVYRGTLDPGSDVIVPINQVQQSKKTWANCVKRHILKERFHSIIKRSCCCLCHCRSQVEHGELQSPVCEWVTEITRPPVLGHILWDVAKYATQRHLMVRILITGSIKHSLGQIWSHALFH